MSSFQGIWVPVVTPFHDGAIDFNGLRRLVSHLLERFSARWPTPPACRSLCTTSLTAPA